MKKNDRKTIFDEKTQLMFAEQNRYLLDLLNDGKIKELKEEIIKNINTLLFEFSDVIPRERLVEIANFKYRVEIEKRPKGLEVITHHWTEMHRLILETCILERAVKEKKK